MAGIFSINPAFDGMAIELDLVLANADRFASSNAELLGNQVNPSDHLRHRMFNLNSCVHLHEIETAGAVEEKLNRASPFVVNASGCGDGRFTHLSPQLGIQGRAWRFFKQFLVAPLDGAVPFAEMHNIAVTIRQHLHFHVAGAVDEFLHVEPRIAKGRFCFPLGRLVEAFELIGAGHETHASTTTTGSGFDHHGIAHFSRELSGLLWIGQQSFTAWNGGDSHRLHRCFGSGFIAHGPNRMG